MREAARAFPGRVALGLDARGGRVATRGWATESGADLHDLARSYEDAGIAALIYTDIARDGAMQGPNVAATAALARAVSIPVIASGRRVLARRPRGAARRGRHRRAPSSGGRSTTGRWTSRAALEALDGA